MSGPERIYLQDAGDYSNTADGEVTWCAEPQDDGDTEYIRADAVAEMIRQAVRAEREACAIAAGNAAVEALLRQDPDAGLLRRQMARTNAIRAIRAREGEA